MDDAALIIRKAEQDDLVPLLSLYTQLHDNEMPVVCDELLALWGRILTQPGHYVLLGLQNDKLVSSCVLTVVLNLTHGQRPYALIENVITDDACRGRGFASALLGRACEIAGEQNCYKVMLLTGSKDQSTLRFYERAGFNRQDKTAFIRWLP